MSKIINECTPTTMPEEYNVASRGEKASVGQIRHYPVELRHKQQWLCWGGTGIKKQPISPITGNSLEWNTQERWVSQKMAKKYERFGGLKGIGFVLTDEDPYMVLDLDNARNKRTGKLKTWASSLVEHFNSYTEISMSGTGLHIFLRVDQPPIKSIQSIPLLGDNKENIEIFYANKFIAMTGHTLGAKAPIKSLKTKEVLSQINLISGQSYSHDGEGSAIHQGERNNTLFNIALKRFRQEWNRDRVERNIRNTNKHKCRPPLEPDELKNITRSAQKFASPKSLADNTLLSHIEEFTLKSSDYLKQTFKKQESLLYPCLRENSLLEIHAGRGVGKSWFALIIALSLTRNNYEEIEIGPWLVKKPSGVMLVDGEMSNYEIQKRIKSLSASLGKEGEDTPLKILTSAMLHKHKGISVNIADHRWRNSISSYLINSPNLKVLILDNIASLAPGLDENAKKDWDDINQWLLSLRHHGVAVVFIHHEGKAGTQRGTSGREDNLDIVIKLSPLESAHGSFKVEIKKGRYLEPKDYQSFILRLKNNALQRDSLTWKTEKVKKVDNDRDKEILALKFIIKVPSTEIAKLFNMHKSNISHIIKKAIEDGLVKGKGRKAKLTESGEKYLNKVDISKFTGNVTKTKQIREV